MPLDPRPIYLDYQATTPVDPRVREAMLPFLKDEFGNPHSTNHAYGWEASDAVKAARAQVAHLINADDNEIVFTSGATESCNLALRGVARASDEKRNRIITVVTEHPAVLETVKDLGQSGYETVILPVGSDGLLDPADLEQELDERTLLVSVMAVNNEIGVIQPLAQISSLCQSAGALFHTDATQAAGRMEIDVDACGVDLLSFSAHKVYGPKGIGTLFVRSGVRIKPITTGGAQERRLRPGTVPTPLVVGFGEACHLAGRQGTLDRQRMCDHTKRLEAGLRKAWPDLRVFGHREQRIAGNLNVGFPGFDADNIVHAVASKIAVSTGSACASATAEPSRVLLALGLDPEIAATGIRISLGRFTTDQHVEAAIAAFSEVASTANRNCCHEDEQTPRPQVRAGS